MNRLPRFRCRNIVRVEYDNDHGWIVESPNNGEMEFTEGFIGLYGEVPNRITFNEAIRLGKEEAKQRKMPLEVHQRNGERRT